MKAITCLNCGRMVHEKYCGHCGQSAHTRRLDWHYIWHEIPHSILHLDKGLLPTIGGMIVRPAKVVNDYLDGKRVRYYRPLAFLILLGTLASLINLNIPIYKLLSRDDGTAEFFDFYQKLSGKYYNVITIAMIPLFSFTAWLFYRKERNYVEIATSHFYLQGIMALMSVISLTYFLSISKETILMIAMFNVLVSLSYQVWFYTSIFKTRKLWSRISIAFFLVTLNYMLITLIILVLTAYIMINVYGKDNIEINFGT